MRLFAETLPELLITSSCSKNFGLYRERTGALMVIAEDASRLAAVRSQLAPWPATSGRPHPATALR